ncbi:MAG: alpha-glucan family phosphorylase [Rikenellaceae bacterium]|jgi:phosphorylase/glycogen(starch) synthase|nr:alpha-glucan family phosphorylase [Rikenellaceae bacterium]
MTHPAALAMDRLFEVSWEVCNKVGGIHTVVATKAAVVERALGDNYILIGPDIHREGDNPEFAEDAELLKDWRAAMYHQGVRIKVGRWRIEGAPIVVLVDFTSLFASKDSILKFLWETYKVDSISGAWDYIEPVLFGYAAAQVVESYVATFCAPTDEVVAHFHEWMTSSGGLYLRKYVPRVSSVFTTHATVMGRSLAGNGYPLYGGLAGFNADELARRFNVTAKHSLEKTAAEYADAFLTVSDITAEECKYLLSKEVDLVTPNGFEDDFVWRGEQFNAKRAEARAIMIKVAEACWNHKFAKEPLIVGTSGRYEFKNKGLDVFLESLKKLAATHRDREILAYITVPAGNEGARRDLAAHLADPAAEIDRSQLTYTTHYLSAPQWDPIVQSVSDSILLAPESSVKIIFVPTYLDGADGIFNKHYYELLVGMDVTVYASYYEPWGYTPLESIAFSVPTVTTTLAGFGAWAHKEDPANDGVRVVKRTDTNEGEVAERIAFLVDEFAAKTAAQIDKARSDARRLADAAEWEKFIAYYIEAYRIASENTTARLNRDDYVEIQPEQNVTVHRPWNTNTPTWTRLMIEKNLPPRLHALEVLSRNLWWSWAADVSEIFKGIDPALWSDTNNNPIEFLDRLSYARFVELEKDKVFLKTLDDTYAAFQAYMAQKAEQKGPKIAYFSMEYGLHASLKIYSGGLGILAGDYLKEASDKNVPMVAVGLLYRYGYFTQKLSSQGAQEATYEAQNFFKLPISPVRDAKGGWVSVQVALPGRSVTARVWRCDVGRTELLLLDTDHELNLPEDRSITHYLYGGDWENRLKQEMLLGIGGIRLLNTLGIEQDVFHCNEGHAAFIGIERVKNLVQNSGLSYAEAYEVVRSSALFTTHTPVPAGHDAFDESMMRQYLSHYADIFGLSWDEFMNLGRTHAGDHYEKFSMSALASRLSQEVNGVSWLHGEVTKEILGELWPGYYKDELHEGYVTNGVHFPTWAAAGMRRLYNQYFPEGFNLPDYNIPAWQKVKEIDDAVLWDERMKLKNRLIETITKRIADPKQARYDNPSQVVKVRELLKDEVLTIGFARRFATYKRAYLLFKNLDRLAAIVNNKERPVRFVFAGKAHPNDRPGQDIIKRIIEVSNMPQFVGKVIFLQNYDMNLAKRLVQGVDVWLNTPTRPLEASGTSGEKCVMNGVLQFSVLDGWYVEGYREGAGWMLPQERTYKDQNFQDELDAEMIYTTIEESIVPLYYERGADNIPHGWVEWVKSCVADVASNFTTNRMLTDYEERFYGKLFERKERVNGNDYRLARELAAWKQRVTAAWDNVKILRVKRFNVDREAIMVGRKYHIEVSVDLAGLGHEDVGVEFVIASQIEPGQPIKVLGTKQLQYVKSEGGAAIYAVEMEPSETGSYDFTIRVYPHSDMLAHRMDLPLVKWA